VKSVVAQLKDKGSVSRGWIGVQIQPVTADIAESLGMEQDRADEEGDGVGRVADQLEIAGKRADQEARRPEGEAERHPAAASHDQILDLAALLQ
jgi:hypothetical protein